jgi:hypothetical protein
MGGLSRSKRDSVPPVPNSKDSGTLIMLDQILSALKADLQERYAGTNITVRDCHGSVDMIVVEGGPPDRVTYIIVRDGCLAHVWGPST